MPSLSCSTPECEAPPKVKGMCAKHYHRQYYRGRMGPKPRRDCKQCGVDISWRKADAKFCSEFCSDVSRGARLAKPLPKIVCALDGCDVIFTPNRAGTKCCCENHGQIHWNRKSRAEGRQKNAPWDERRKAHYHKRRALKLQLPADDIRPGDVYERDGWACNICSEPVDRDLSWPDPMSPSLDHVLPLSLGGHHTMENVALAHLSCNVRKGNRVEVDAMSA
jgi:5-methylcytosine-specific restriction endonuclease McrA